MAAHRHDHAHSHHDHAGHDPHDHTGHDHHDHHHDHRATPARRLTVALVLTLSFMGVEVVAGWWSGSLALLSDAGHMLSDAGALALALAAQRVAERPRTRTRTFGFRRAETLAALANAGALIAAAIFVAVEAVERLEAPRAIASGPMIAVAITGLLVNLASAAVLAGGARGEARNANVKAALAHVLSDAAGSVAAIGAGVAIALYDWRWADPVCSIAIAVLVAFAAYRLIRNAADVLMESAPAGLDMAELEATIRGAPGVADMHDLHAWRIEEGFDAVTVHVVLSAGAHGVEVAREVALRIRRAHGVEHVTVQPEAMDQAASLIPASALIRSSTRPLGG